MRRRSFVSGLSSAVVVSVVGTQVLAQTPEASPVATREITHPRGTTVFPANPQRVIALGEEWMLADLLELGIKPIASASNFADIYMGIDPVLTTGLVPFSLFEMDFEYLLSLQPDLILVPEFVFDYDPTLYELFSQMAPVVSIPDVDVWQQNFLTLAAVFGLEEKATEIIGTLEIEIESASQEFALAGQTVSVGTIYQGSGILTLWLSKANPLVDLMIRLGLTVRPNAAEYEMDENGRTEISLEQVAVVDGETLIMLQTSADYAPDEQASFDEALASPLWQTIPAVTNDRVFILERVGFPGDVPGRRKLLDEYRRIFG